MPNIVIAENGKIRNVANVELAEKITDMRAKKDPWVVIDEMVRFWAKNAPDEAEAVRINVAQYRETATDKKFGQTKQGGDQERRFQLAFPRSLMLMIRSQYKSDELPMDRKFFHDFGTKYPFFRVAESD